MDLLNNLEQLTPQQRQLFEELLKKQDVDVTQLLDNETSYNNIVVSDEKEYYEMSSAQKRLFVLNQLEGKSTTYNMPVYLVLEGKLDENRIKEVFNKLVDRHEALRTSFHSIDGKLVQKINDNIKIKIVNVEASESEVENIIKDFVVPFDLNIAPLMRVMLIKINAEKHILAFDIHHIISDAITMGVIIEEIGKLYKGQELPSLRLQYKDFSEWQNNQIEEGKLKKQEQYWMDMFSDEIPLLDMPTVYQRSTSQNFEGKSFYFNADEVLTKKLEEIAKKNGCTLYIVLLAVYNLLLSKYTGQYDIVVGCPVAGRVHADLEKVVGMFVNVLPVRNHLDSEKTFVDFLKAAKKSSLKELENQDYQFEMLVEKLNIKRELGRNPLFDTVFVMQNTGIKELNIDGLKVTSFDIENNISKFDITLNVDKKNDSINFKLEYKTNLYNEEFMRRLAGHYINLLNSIIKNPYEKLGNIEIISDLEKHQIFEEFNTSICNYPSNKTIQDIFEEQVERYPNKIAVSFMDQSLTYKELNAKSNKLARLLRKKGVKPDTVVTLMVEQSLNMIVGIIAILKAGGAYLSIDTGYPKERIKFILEDSKSKLVLVDNFYKDELKFDDAELINIDDEKNYLESDINIENINSPSDLAYIIYTSGTTGKPKGVMLEHKNLVRLLYNDDFQFDFSSNDVWTMFHSISFDFSVWEMYGALLYGGKLVIVHKLVAREPSEFYKLLVKEKVTVLNQTPTAFLNIVRLDSEKKNTELKLRYIIFGGEALSPSLLKPWKNKYPKVKLINMYGITETTVHVTYKEIGNKEIDDNISNIGRAIPTLNTYIMDENLKLVPIGVRGEICVGGEGVCRGYLNRQELTDKKFVKNPYKSNERIYRSGDLARWLPNGELEYLGRIDNQVKIRGHRIELGEIENKLVEYELIKEAVVLAKKDSTGINCLCAYIVAREDITINEIRSHLAKELPEYMIPAYFVNIKSMPLNSNGKVDRKNLPEPELNLNTGVEYERPKNEVENVICKIWTKVLDLKKVGVTDNFFSVGGDSIKAISIINSINKQLKTNLKMKDIYVNQTIREIASTLEHREQLTFNDELKLGLNILDDIKNNILKDEKQKLMLPNDWEDLYPLSQIQNGMVFYSKLRPEDPIYHDQFIFTIKIKKFDEDMCIDVLKILMNRHTILRTVFITENVDIPIQVVRKNIEPNLIIKDIAEASKENQKEIIKEYISKDIKNKFKFNYDILWRMGIFKVNNDDTCYIILSFQHAILDGWSVSVFNKEFIEIYTKLSDGEVCNLPNLKSSYKDYVAINKMRKISVESKKYWKDLFYEYSRNKLPFNINGKLISKLEGSRIVRKNLKGKLLNQIDEVARKYNCSIKDVCLSAHIYLLSILTKEKSVITGLVTHDRPIIDDSSNILGCFLNTVPLKVEIDQEIDKGELINKVKKNLKDLKQHEIFLSDIVSIIGSTERKGNPIFDTLFNFTDFYVLQDVEDQITTNETDYDLNIESNEMTNTLFDLEVSKTMNSFTMQIKYAPQYFYREEIEYAIKLYIRILETFADDRVKTMNIEKILGKEEIKSIIHEINDTTVEYSREKTIHGLFEEQVIRTPNNIALVYENKTITYKQLNEKSNQLARILMSKGIKDGDNIGLITKRGFKMIIGMLAILKVGATYVPIDPEYPINRVSYIIDKSNLAAIVLDEIYENYSVKNIINIDYKEMDELPMGNLNIKKSSKDLAYVIYTSGSTGNPKGVMIEHHSAVNLIEWVNRRFNVGSNDALLFITSMCFDLSVYDIFGILSCGGKIVIEKKENIQNFNKLVEVMREENITFWDSVPSTMSYLVNYLDLNNMKHAIESLRIIFMSGDWIPVNIIKGIKKYFPNSEIISLGGATEAAIWSIFYKINKVEAYQTTIPYGKPINNNYFYILDDYEKVVPRGVVGELYIGGVGVARGYMNDVEKTKASFVHDRFQTEGTGVMYKTGDLGRLLPDGNIEFIGRKDYQVKIRGYRIELEEIESQLRKNNLIKDAVVVDRLDKDGSKYLCAYIAAEVDTSVSQLKQYLLTKLPEYMIPTYFIRMDHLPLNMNGKVDRKALPDPDESLINNVEYEEPKSEIEKKLVDIWKEVLDKKSIGINDNFFDLGGHSLKATTLAAKINKNLNVEIPLKEIFNAPTIKEIAKYIENTEVKEHNSIPIADKKDYYALSSVQRRLYILSQKEEALTAYNTADATTILGDIDVNKFEYAFNKLIERHEALRTSFELIDGEPVQVIHDDVKLNIEYCNAEEEFIDDALKDFVRPFDLTLAPLMRVKLINVNEGKYILAYDMHHIISDGISMKIIVKEFIELYNGKKLPTQIIHYKDFSEWQNSIISNNKLKKQEEYWVKVFNKEVVSLNLPTDYERPKVQSFSGDSITIDMKPELEKRLKDFANQLGSTIYMVLLASYNILLYKYTGQEDIVIGSPVSGRSNVDIENVIGMFVNTLPMRNYPSGEKLIIDFVKEITNNSIEAFENQDYQFEDLLKKLNIKIEVNRNPIFDVMFVLQNIGEASNLAMSGLKVIPYEFKNRISKFDLTLEVTELNNRLILKFEYCTKLFNKSTIEVMAKDYLEVLNRVINESNIRIKDIELERNYDEQESVISDEEISFNF